MYQKPLIKYPNTVPGTFVRRLNRFTAEVMVHDQLEKVHVKNTGRLKELLLAGAKVTLQKSDNPSRKTAETGGDRGRQGGDRGTVLVCRFSRKTTH